jgi:SWIM zinc finger
LVPALDDIFPGAEQRFCVRHLYENFKGSYKGKGLKDILWGAARASYEYWMNEMNNKDVEAYKWLKAKPAHQWSRSHFSSRVKCDMLLNNCCECFNKMILDSREKPILSMLESIRCKLMNRIYTKQIAMQKYSGDICPKIQKKLEKIKDLSSKCWPEPSSFKKFQVKCITDQFCIDMEAQTCSCRRWQLSGVPCSHAVSVMFFNKENPETYVDDCYHLATYSRIYEFSINPVNGHKMWPKSSIMCLPPLVKNQPGRPKKKRKKSTSEDNQNSQKMRKTGGKSTCSRCKQEGHNARTCKMTSDNVDGNMQSNRVQKLPIRRVHLLIFFPFIEGQLIFRHNLFNNCSIVYYRK